MSAHEDAQHKILSILKEKKIHLKDIANETRIPYTTVRDIFYKPRRLTVDWLVWFNNLLGTTTDYLLSLDKPDNVIGTNFKSARDEEGLSLKGASDMLNITEYALNKIEEGEMEATLSTFRKAIEVYQVFPDLLLGTNKRDEITINTSSLRDAKIFMTCMEISNRPILNKLFSMVRKLSDNELGRVSRVFESIIDELIIARPSSDNE